MNASFPRSEPKGHISAYLLLTFLVACIAAIMINLALNVNFSASTQLPITPPSVQMTQGDPVSNPPIPAPIPVPEPPAIQGRPQTTPLPPSAAQPAPLPPALQAPQPVPTPPTSH